MNLKKFFVGKKSSRICDMAIERKEFMSKNVGNVNQMEKNLMKILFIDDNQNYRHWQKEFVNAFFDILKSDIKKDNNDCKLKKRCLKTIIIDEPYGEDYSTFVKSSMYSLDCAFADEDKEYVYNEKKGLLEQIKKHIIDFLLSIIEKSNEFQPELRFEIYNGLTHLKDKILNL